MPSVAAKILTKLAERLQEIRGQGSMVNDLQGRVYLRRFSYDLDIEEFPAVFLSRRIGGGAELVQKPGVSTLSDIGITFDVVGVIALCNDSALAGESLLADLQRAIEIPGDEFLKDLDTGKNLLNAELRIVDVFFDPPPIGISFDLTGIGIRCTYPHRYGDPDYVE